MIKVGEYIRTPYGIGKITNIPKHNKWFDDGFSVEDKFIECGYKFRNTLTSTPNILELLELQDLLYIDIDNAYEGGIIVPRIPETQAELNKHIENFKNGKTTLKGVIPHEILQEHIYWIDDKK